MSDTTTDRTPKVPHNGFRVLLWVPGEDRPEEWATVAGLAEQLADVYGPDLVRDVDRLLSRLKRASYVVSRRDPSGVTHWRRTPTGTAASAEYQEKDQW